jgi:hypothetical protein
MYTAPKYRLPPIPMTMRSTAPLATDDDCFERRAGSGILPARGLKMVVANNTRDPLPLQTDNSNSPAGPKRFADWDP